MIELTAEEAREEDRACIDSLSNKVCKLEKEARENYAMIVKERDKRLARGECSYNFAVAHGLTEALRIIDKVGIYSEVEEED